MRFSDTCVLCAALLTLATQCAAFAFTASATQSAQAHDVHHARAATRTAAAVQCLNRRASRTPRRLHSSADDASSITAEQEDEWAETGRKGRVLKRKKDVPAPEYSPEQVCDKVLRALQLNDDPMLDYGAAVMVKFASPLNAAAALTPSQYGGYLRAGEFEVLLENSRFGLSGPLRMAESGKRCVQRATVVGPPPALTKFEFDIQLSRTDVPEKGECWLIDTVTRHSV